MSCEGLFFRTVNLQDDDYNRASIWFDLVKGFAEPSEVRGEDYDLPGAVGRVWAPKVRSSRIIEITGFVRGVGSSLEERQQSWRTSTDALMDLMQFDDDPGPMVVVPPYLGTQSEWTIDAVAINTLGGPVTARMTFQSWSIQLISVDPEWVAGGSS